MLGALSFLTASQAYDRLKPVAFASSRAAQVFSLWAHHAVALHHTLS